jgi:hypothetical protein
MLLQCLRSVCVEWERKDHFRDREGAATGDGAEMSEGPLLAGTDQSQIKAGTVLCRAGPRNAG